MQLEVHPSTEGDTHSPNIQTGKYLFAHPLDQIPATVVESSQRHHHRKNASTFQTTRLSETSFNAVVAEVFDRSQKLLRYLFADLGKIRAESCPFLMLWQLAGARGARADGAARWFAK